MRAVLVEWVDHTVRVGKAHVYSLGWLCREEPDHLELITNALLDETPCRGPVKSTTKIPWGAVVRVADLKEEEQ
jgi:hypothetical protein